MNSYTIRRCTTPPPLHGGVDGPWAKADSLQIDQYPWYRSGLKQDTTVRVLYDDAAVYLQFVCQDKHIFSQTTQLNGPVCTDSCVEFFATIDPAKGPDYFNFEANCSGVMHLGFGPQRQSRRLITAELAKEIIIKTSLAAPTKEEAASDSSWWLAASIPFNILARHAGVAVKPQAGTVWRGNFYRCGGKTDSQFAAWNVVGTPGPDFHRPEFFGQLRFE